MTSEEYIAHVERDLANKGALARLWQRIWCPNSNLGSVVIDNARVQDLIRLGRR